MQVSPPSLFRLNWSGGFLPNSAEFHFYVIIYVLFMYLTALDAEYYIVCKV